MAQIAQPTNDCRLSEIKLLAIIGSIIMQSAAQISPKTYRWIFFLNSEEIN